MVWVAIGISIFSMVASYYLQPSPQVPDNALAAEAVDVPTADAGRKIPVVFGRVMVKDSNVVWWGDLFTTEIIRGEDSKK